MQRHDDLLCKRNQLVIVPCRTKIYYDAHLLDTFFDAGGDVNMGMIACFIVAKWTWTASFSWSTNATVKVGVHTQTKSTHVLMAVENVSQAQRINAVN